MSQLGDETSREAAERGRKEGRETALLEEHSKHLGDINGSVAATGEALGALKDELHRQGVDFSAAVQRLENLLTEKFNELVSDIRKLNEDQKIRDTALTVAAEGIAKQTEERREALATSGTLFTKRQGIVATALTVIGLIVALYFYTH